MRTQGGYEAMMRAALDGARLELSAARRRAASAEAAWANAGTLDAQEAFRAAHRAMTVAAAEVAELEEEFAFPELMDEAA